MTSLLDFITDSHIRVRVSPKASRNAIKIEEGGVRVYITTAPENGKANAAAAKLLAKELGIAKSKLTLTRGAKSRDKVFKVEH
ncbi:MAG: DUF167 domain-containing protein [Robiginitomaculum sp.]